MWPRKTAGSPARVDARDNDVAAGNIIETEPAAGSSLEKGGTLTYYLSRGKPLVAVPPDLVGKAAAEGRELLTQAGFNVAEPKWYSTRRPPRARYPGRRRGQQARD